MGQIEIKKQLITIHNTLILICQAADLYISTDKLKDVDIYFFATSNTVRDHRKVEIFYNKPQDIYYFRYTDRSQNNKGINTWTFQVAKINDINEQLLELPVLKQYLRDQKLKELLK